MPERVIEYIHKIGRIIQTFSQTQLMTLFDEYDICNSLILQLTAVSKTILLVNPDSSAVLIEAARGIKDQAFGKRAI